MPETISVAYHTAYEVIQASMRKQPELQWEIDRPVQVEAREITLKYAEEWTARRFHVNPAIVKTSLDSLYDSLDLVVVRTKLPVRHLNQEQFQNAVTLSGRLDGFVNPHLAVIRGYHKDGTIERITFQLLNDKIGKEVLIPTWEELKKYGD